MPAVASTKTPIPGLSNFDELPGSAEVRAPVVAHQYACSVATVWRRVKTDSNFPRPRRRGNITSWVVGDIRAHKAAAQ